jgi:zinc protease
MAAPAAPSQPQSIDPATVHREVLPNGLVVLVRRDDSAPAAAVNTYVKAGYFDETDDVVGIAHVLEHMFFKGTPSRGVGEIAKQTKASGGYLNAHTIYDHTSYYAVLPSAGFEAGLANQADAYANSVIDAAELAKELEVIIQEANRKLDNPSAVVTETLYELLHDRHRIRRWRIGREAGLRRLTRDDLVRFYRNFYQPHNTVLSVVGDVDVDHAMRLVRRHYGSLPDAGIERSPGPTETGATGARYRELSGDVAQTQVAMGWRTPGMLHPDTPLLDLAAGVLATGRASRLYRAVRERRLASSVSAYNFTPVELGVFLVHLECEPHLTADARAAAWAQLGALARRRDARRAGAAAAHRRGALAAPPRDHGGAGELPRRVGGGGRLDARGRVPGAAAGRRAGRRGRGLRAARGSAQAGPWCTGRPARPRSPRRSPPSRRCSRPTRRPARPLPERPAVAPAVISRRAEFEREEAGVRVYRTDAGVPILVRVKPGAAIVQLGVARARRVGRGVGRAGRPHVAHGARERQGHRAPERHRDRRGRRAARRRRERQRVVGERGVADLGPAQNASAAAELLADVVQRPTFPGAGVRHRAHHGAGRPGHAARRHVPLSACGWQPRGVRRPRVRPRRERAPRSRWPGSTRAGARLAPGPGAAQHVGAGRGGATWTPTRSPHARARVPRARAARADARCRRPAGPRATVTAVESRDKAQTALALLFPGPARADDDRFAAGLLAGIASGLGGRFFDELRDRRSLAYTVHAFAGARRLAGTFGAYIATSPAKEEVARAGCWRSSPGCARTA